MQKCLTRPPILLGSHNQLSITMGPISSRYRPRIDATLLPYRLLASGTHRLDMSLSSIGTGQGLSLGVQTAPPSPSTSLC